MPSTHDQVFNLDDELDALSTPTTLEVLAHSQDYDADIVAAAAARRAINATGGGPGGPVAAEDVSFDPAGNISSTDVQAAIEELDAQIVSAVSDLVASAPGALDTLDELAAALGDDANFATTVTNALAAKQPLDSDLTAIAALSTTPFGIGLLELANQAALLAAAGATDSARTITAGSGLSGGGDLTADRTLDVNVDGSTLEINADALRVKAAGILASHIGDAELAALAGLVSAADMVPYFTGSGTASLATLTSAGRSLIDDNDNTAQRATLGLGTAATSAATDFLAATAAAGGSLAGNYPNPRIAPGKAQNNLLSSVVSGSFAESLPRFLIANNLSLLNTGRLSSVLIPVLQGTPCTNVSFGSATTQAGTPTNWWFALCDASYNVIRQSTDQLSTAWAANTVKTLALDSIPVTAGARSASTTVTLTIPTLSEALTSLVAIGDSITISNANIGAYNGTFTVTNVTSTQIQYTAGSSATDSLSAPFPTVQLAVGKRVYTTTADIALTAVIMVKATTVPTLAGYSTTSAISAYLSLTPVYVSSGDTSLTGTCPSPIAHGTGASIIPWAAIS